MLFQPTLPYPLILISGSILEEMKFLISFLDFLLLVLNLVGCVWLLVSG